VECKTREVSISVPFHLLICWLSLSSSRSTARSENTGCGDRKAGPDRYLKINGEIFRDTTNPSLPRHALWRPGMNWDAVGELDPHTRHPMNEGAWDPQARLADMDAMGVDQTLLFPTWFAEGFFLVRDPDVAYALARAYNDWIATSARPRRNGFSPLRYCRCRTWISHWRNCSGWRECHVAAPSLSGRCFLKVVI
jgi:hypothetical protein